MNLGLASALRGLPALVGVVLGVYLFASPLKYAIWLPLLALAVLSVVLSIAHGVFNERPMLGLALTEPWTLTAVALVATLTGIVLWMTVNLETLVGLPATDAKAVSGALIGAFTTFAATAWIKEIQEANGLFVASGQAKLHFQGFAAHHKLIGDNVARELCESETAVAKGIEVKGWGMTARWQRARMLQAFLKSGKKPLPRD
jgi:hypothetical protein